MAKKSRESIIAELDARKVGYNEEMTDDELAGLLKDAIEKDKEAKKLEEQAKLESGIDYSGIRCGLSTIQNLHRRLTIVERKLGLGK